MLLTYWTTIPRNKMYLYKISSGRCSNMSYIQLLTDSPPLMPRLCIIQWYFSISLSPHFSCRRWEDIITVLLFAPISQFVLNIITCWEFTQPCWYKRRKQMYLLKYIFNLLTFPKQTGYKEILLAGIHVIKGDMARKEAKGIPSSWIHFMSDSR